MTVSGAPDFSALPVDGGQNLPRFDAEVGRVVDSARGGWSLWGECEKVGRGTVPRIGQTGHE